MRWYISILLTVGFFVSCTTVPLTGRHSITLMPESELVEMSLTGYQQVLNESKLSTNQPEIDQVKRVGQRLAQATETYLRENGYPTDSYQWEFNLLEDPEMVNAFCMPGGKIAVYSGLLPVAQDDAGLSTVMGHEIAHALARHGNERMSQAMIVDMGGQALSVALQNQPERTGQIFRQSYGALTQVGVMMPYSRLHETEADRIGLMLMARAGYDPRAAVQFWTRMEQEGGDRPPQWMSTHPNPRQRIAQLKSFMPEAMKAYESRP